MLVILVLTISADITLASAYATCTGATSYTNPFCPPYDLQDHSNSNTARMYIDSSGHVGIGTTKPAYLLHVGNASAPPNPQNSLIGLYSNTNPISNYLELGNSSDLYFYLYKDNYPNLWFFSNQVQNTIFDSPSGGNYQFFTGTGGTSTAKLSINNGGNVGIGTESPSGSLHVLRNEGTISRVAGFQSTSGTQTQDLVTIGGYSGGGYNLIKLESANGGTLGSGTSRFVVQAGGNVGIDTSSPQQALDVAGNIRMSGSGTSKIVSPNNICIGAC